VPPKHRMCVRRRARRGATLTKLRPSTPRGVPVAEGAKTLRAHPHDVTTSLGFSNPLGVAVEIYVADTGNNALDASRRH